MTNPLKALQKRLEEARMADDRRMNEFINKNHPGGMGAWESEYNAMTPEQKNELVPLSTRAIRKVGRGIQSFADRLRAARSKTK